MQDTIGFKWRNERGPIFKILVRARIILLGPNWLKLSKLGTRSQRSCNGGYSSSQLVRELARAINLAITSLMK